MTLRNMDGYPELMESEGAHFYIGILSVNSDQRQRGVELVGAAAARDKVGLSSSRRHRQKAGRTWTRWSQSWCFARQSW